MNKNIVWMFLWGSLLSAESFIITPSKKKQPKIVAQDCCEQILKQMKNFARIMQYSGQLETLELEWVENFLEDKKNTFFKVARPEDINECYQVLKKLENLQEQYELGLHQIRDELKEINQKLSAPKSKK